MKKLAENYRLQFGVIVIFAILYGVRSSYNTIGRMASSHSYIGWISILTILIGTILLIGVTYLTLKKDKKIEQIYPMVGMALGIIYMLVIPIYITPDETYHFCGAYNVSNELLGIDRPEDAGKIYMRKCDSEKANTSLKGGAYADFGKAFHQKVDTKLVESHDFANGDTSAGSYLIPALGITLGRLLHLNFPALTMLGTLFNLAWFILWMTYALKKIPIGKRILFTILVLPMTLQQASSFSRDNPLMYSVTLIVCLTLHWKYDEEKIKWSEVLIYLYASYVVVTVKSSLYAYMVLFSIFILINKQWFIGKYKQVTRGMIVAILLLGFIFVFPMHGGSRVITLLTTEFYQASTGEYGHSAWYYVTHIGELMQTIINTFIKYGEDYVLQLTGNGLGWLEVPNSVKIRVAYIVMTLVAVIRTQKEKVCLTVQTRVFNVLFGVGGILLCLSAMLLLWTPTSQLYIEGIQGRYFLPLLLPIFIGLGYWRRPVIPLDLDRYYPIMLSITGYVVAIGVIRYCI